MFKLGRSTGVVGASILAVLMGARGMQGWGQESNLSSSPPPAPQTFVSVSSAVPSAPSSAAAAEVSLRPAAHDPSVRPLPHLGGWDYTLDLSVLAARALDFTSTERCLALKHDPVTGAAFSNCREIELPLAVAAHPGRLAAFEVAVTLAQAWGERWTVRHNRGRLRGWGRRAQLASVGAILETVRRNYSLAGKTSAWDRYEEENGGGVEGGSGVDLKGGRK